ncbi:hypothetical protein [Nocardia goodfellowii]|uniref:Uncharacterized protein n=1 Tax=Nocardia goodfellowii TaxID=882446 RepID=A0ABS4QKK6_9NOCA|nr:hypothetical protein [Nocardia goodfellowii]MBP2192231.1 hypothetical protein [Nocardia goodfellowii]
MNKWITRWRDSALGHFTILAASFVGVLSAVGAFQAWEREQWSSMALLSVVVAICVPFMILFVVQAVGEAAVLAGIVVVYGLSLPLLLFPAGRRWRVRLLRVDRSAGRCSATVR